MNIRRFLAGAALACAPVLASAQWIHVSADKQPTGTLGHAAAVKADGSLWVIGENQDGQLGLGDVDSRLGSWVRVPNVSGAIKAFATRNRTFVLLANGSVLAAGNNAENNLGIEGDVTRYPSFTVVSGLENVVSIVGVWALKADGTAVKLTSSCGTNGQGYGHCVAGEVLRPLRATPTTIATGLTSVISNGKDCTLYTRSDNFLYAVGATTVDPGQCAGTANSTLSTTEQRARQGNGASSVISSVRAITDMYAVRTDGTLSTLSGVGYWVPLGGSMIAAITSVDKISAAPFSIGAAKSFITRQQDGTVRVLGANDEGKLGVGSTATVDTVSILANLSVVNQVAYGKSATFAITADGALMGAGHPSLVGLPGPSILVHAPTGFADVDPLAGLEASQGSYSDKVALSWQADSNASYFEVQRSSSQGGPWGVVGNFIGGNTFADLPPDGLTYWYRGRGHNGRGAGQFGEPVSGWKNLAPTKVTADIRMDYGASEASSVALIYDGNPQDSHVVTVTRQPADGTIAVSGNQLVFTPRSDLGTGGLSASSDNSFEVLVTDSGGLTVSGVGHVGQRCQIPTLSFISAADAPVGGAGNGTAMYSAEACVTGAQLRVRVLNGAVLVSEQTLDVPVPARNGLLSVAGLPTVAPGQYTMQATLSASVTTGAYAGTAPEQVAVAESRTGVYSVFYWLPSQVQALSATQGTRSDGVTLEWTASSYAEGYRVLRTKSLGDPAVKIADLPSTARSYLDVPQDAGRYYYTVEAFNSSGVSERSVLAEGWRNFAPTSATALVSYVPGESSASAPLQIEDINPADSHVVTILAQPAEGTVSVFGKQIVFSPRDGAATKSLSDVNTFRFSVTDRGGETITGVGYITTVCGMPELLSGSVPSGVTQTANPSGITLGYSLPSCSASPALSFDVMLGTEKMAALTATPTTGRNLSLKTEGLPPLPAGAYEIVARLSAQVADGSLTADKQAVRNLVERTLSIPYAVEPVKLPELRANKWSAYQNDDAVLIEMVQGANSNCPVTTQDIARANTSKCFARWLEVPSGLSERSGAAVPTIYGAPIEPGDQRVTLGVYKYDAAGNALPVGEISRTLTVTGASLISFSFSGTLKTRRAVEDVAINMVQSAGPPCELTLDPTEASVRSTYDGDSRVCLVAFPSLPSGLSARVLNSRDKVAIYGRVLEVGQIPVDYEVRRFFRDGGSTVLVNSTMLIDVEEAPKPELVFYPVRGSGVDGLYTYGTGAAFGVLGRAVITNAAAGLIKMEFLEQDEVTATHINLRRGSARFVTVKADGVKLWSTKPVVIRASYVDFPSVYSEIELNTVASLPKGVRMGMTAPFRVLDTDGDIPFEVTIAAVVNRQLESSSEVIGDWDVHLIELVRREPVVVSETIRAVDGKATFMMPPNGFGRSAIAVATPVFPQGVNVPSATLYSAKRGTRILKGSEIEGELAIAFKKLSNGAVMTYLEAVVDSYNKSGMGSFQWLFSNDGVNFAPDTYTLLKRAVIANAAPVWLKVGFVNRYTGRTSETNAVEISLAASGLVEPSTAAQLSSASTAFEPAKLWDASLPIELRVLTSNATNKAPMNVALQSLTNTQTANYMWFVDGRQVPGLNTYKATIALPDTGQHTISVRSGADGQYGADRTFNLVANRLPECSFAKEALDVGVKYTATCADPDGALNGMEWLVNGVRISSRDYAVFRVEADQTLESLFRVRDDSNDVAEFRLQVAR